MDRSPGSASEIVRNRCERSIEPIGSCINDAGVTDVQTERNDMRPHYSSALVVMLLMAWSIPAQETSQPAGRGRQGAGSQADEAAARYAAADVRVLTVGIIFNAGLVDLAASFTKE